MAKTLGYMLTWTTYGTWLQGDERGYVKDGEVLPANEMLMQANKNLQIQDIVKLSVVQQDTVRQAILKEAILQKQRIYALSVQSNHVHLVAEYTPQPIEKIVAYYKKAGRLALKSLGRDGKVWTAGYDKRFCFNKETLERKIRYVQNHNK
jgi:REP element-mobilizing transposase RayT